MENIEKKKFVKLISWVFWSGLFNFLAHCAKKWVEVANLASSFLHFYPQFWDIFAGFSKFWSTFSCAIHFEKSSKMAQNWEERKMKKNCLQSMLLNQMSQNLNLVSPAVLEFRYYKCVHSTKTEPTKFSTTVLLGLHSILKLEK